MSTTNHSRNGDRYCRHASIASLRNDHSLLENELKI